MKRQRSATTTVTKTKGEYDDVKMTMTKKMKKNRRGDEKAKADDVAAEISGTFKREHETGALNNFSCTWWDGAADEHMSWSTYWLPSWDVEFVGECHNNVFYGDVVWDDDIWGLRGITQVPNS